jgi:excisionase family DNA binding protein
MLTTEPQLLNVKQVADYLSMAPLTLYRLIAKNKIPHERVGCGYRFRQEDVDLYLRMKSSEGEVPDVVIGYGAANKRVADFAKTQLKAEGQRVFMAPVPFSDGKTWAGEVRRNVNNSLWTVMLASKDACETVLGDSEVVANLGGGDKIVPVVWDMEPRDLPYWMPRDRVLDLRGITIEDIRSRMTEIAEDLQADLDT